MLLERESEIRSVAASMRDAIIGHGHLIVIAGPLGAGRTHLLRTLPEHADGEGVLTLQASGTLAEQDFAFGVVHQLLDAALLLALPETQGEWFSGEAEEKTLANLHRLMIGLSERYPLLVLVDDAQWADAPSLSWLNGLVARMRASRILMVLTVCEGDPMTERPPVREITGRATRYLRLGPLSPGATEVAVAAEFGEPGDEGFVRGCHEASAGRPLFLMSLLTELRLLGYRPIAEHAEAARSLLPSAPRERVTTCLRTQSVAVQRFASALTVLDGSDSRELLCPLAGLDPAECAEAGGSLVKLGLTTPKPYRFFPHAVREAVEQMMAPNELSTLHFRVAELLHDGGSPTEKVAAHLLLATNRQAHWVLTVLRTAGKTAFDRGNFDSATRYLRRALMNCPREDETRAQLLVDLATTERPFDPLLSAQHLAEALPLLDSTTKRGRAAVRSEPMVLGLRRGAALELMEQLHDDLGEPERLAGEAREIAIQLEARLRYARHCDPAQLADAVDRLSGLGHQPPMSTVGERELVGALLMAATVSGKKSAEVTDLGQRILRLESTALGRVPASTALIVRSLIAADSLRAATAWLDLVSSAELQHPDPSVRTFISVQRALIALRKGELTNAANLVLYALDLADPSPLTSWESCVHALVLIAMYTGDAVLAARLLSRCGEYEPVIRTPWLSKLFHGSIAATTGNPAVALEYFHGCGRELDAAGWRNPEIVPWRSWAAVLHHRLGQQATARELIEEEYSRAITWNTRQGQGRSLRVWGTIIDGDVGIELLRKSAVALDDSANGLERAKTALALGERLHHAGHPDAGPHLTLGNQLAEQLGASWLVQATAPPPTPAPTIPRAGLTSSERKVAALATSGMTNQVIARKLEVTRRTVEKHLTNVYRKLDLKGREELADAMLAVESTTTDLS